MPGAFYDACPDCQAAGHNLNYETIYDLRGAKLPPRETGQPGIFRFRDFYPLADGAPVVSLHEGNTPLYRLERLGAALGFENLYIKDESRNPTCSHKDRMCAVIVSKALADGAPGIVISSTGNQGAAAAAYASAAGLPCLIFTTPNVSETMKTFMQIYGAYLFVLPTMADRVTIMERCVRELGFTPASGLMSPPIGSSCFGVDGYKSISFEIFEQMGNALPDWMVIPISYGDAFYGVYKGMRDLAEMGYATMPHLAAAEALGALKATLASGSEFPEQVPYAPSIQTSIATGDVAYQAVQAARASRGAAETCSDAEALEMQKRLARTEGLYAEPASVASLVAAAKLLRQGKIKPAERVVVMITSTGLKDPEASRAALPDIPRIAPDMGELTRALKTYYGYQL